MRASVLFLLAAMVLLSGPVFAAEPGVHDPSIPSSPASVAKRGDQWSNRNNIMATFGFAMPNGYFGIEYGFDVTQNIQIAAGGGVGRVGGQLSGMVRYRYIGAQNNFFQVGLGVSGGELPEDFNAPLREDNEEFGIKRAYWANAELAYGWRYKSGFQLRWTLGVTGLLNRDDAECMENCTHTSAGGTTVPTRLTSDDADISSFYVYFGLSIGYTF